MNDMQNKIIVPTTNYNNNYAPNCGKRREIITFFGKLLDFVFHYISSYILYKLYVEILRKI